MTSQSATAGGNRLAGETSPYLLQHKDNPVDWWPWGPEAFEQARLEGKPVLLSVGYAACHWCHVMAHESFESESIAALMNSNYVSIKVDREERPDLDTIYQSALALLGEHGGWPLTMFLTAEAEPFWGGTYFPPEPRFGRPGFPDVLRTIARLYKEEPDKVGKNVGALKEALGNLAANQSGGEVSIDAIDLVAKRLVREVDPFNGGIGTAPKFPQCSIMKLLWRAFLRSGEAPFREAVIKTLTQMCQGGIYDHLGGGFARYAVDERWLVPHFEKMLYDNAQMIQLLAEVGARESEPLFRQRLGETVDWVLREMLAERSPGGEKPGAFASTLDADSEGEEGRFYVWQADEIDLLLGDGAALFKGAYDVSPAGNWEGKIILNRLKSTQLRAPEDEARLAAARETLFSARAKRVHPGWDDKVLADWNGLMIAALAQAATSARVPAWLEAARRAFDFVQREMQKDGRLMHSWRHGKLKHAATLDDYAAMTLAAAALYERTGEAAYLQQATAWIERLDADFWDEAGGGYFFTAADARDVIVRTKTAYDNASPSGNGMMAEALARLYYLTGDVRLRERAAAVVAAFSGELSRNFFPLASLLNAAELLQDAHQVVIIGARGEPGAEALLAAAFAAAHPAAVVQLVAPGESLSAEHPANGKGQLEGRATAYLCQGQTCGLPISEPEDLTRQLRGRTLAQ